MRDIHNKGYIHGDIKQDNILLESNNSTSKLILIDFGFSQPNRNQNGTHIIDKEESKFMGNIIFSSRHSMCNRSNQIYCLNNNCDFIYY